MSCPLVSVVVPTYNQARYLGACLDSIWFQDWPNIELVVVDDCSTDETRQVIERFAADVADETASFASYYDEAADVIERTVHPRYRREGRTLTVLRNETNRGSTPTYNRGFRAAGGDYCTYVASDDLLHPQMVSTLARPLDAGEADFVYSDMFVFDDAMRILREFKVPDYSFDRCFRDWYLCGVSKLYRRSLHERCGWYDETYLANDHDLYLRFALAGARFLHVPRTLYSVRTHDNRAVNVHSSANWARLLEESKRLVRSARAAATPR
ncbi:PGL/p-HBAD biosynthesis glycosyltransferase [Fundidesulfovibrio magnetotacticus]|uniref:PGL/p-HBAD biosynthesis glycosyltransferase n=1 Tax=Fundidesulfovibrio magnetotacticus TaxID=2730080 RepID=A0A6V8M290_9BACT|nr:glycosyltransferase [Fundidesulfovibrio magnetotacticus]GFK95937.1 PGL/p-HBAD biosynthesis glycosyltransferase [Fundidesulfovibrio magnetotacticus]